MSLIEGECCCQSEHVGQKLVKLKMSKIYKT